VEDGLDFLQKLRLSRSCAKARVLRSLFGARKCPLEGAMASRLDG